jgi:hypothetical protein
LINWHHQTDDDWPERPLGWVRDCGCDAWLIQSGSADPLTYACIWLRQTEAQDLESYRRQLDEWLAYYARLGAARLSRGHVILRRRAGLRHAEAATAPQAGAHWVRRDEFSVPQGLPLGIHLETIFRCEDWLQAHPTDADVLDDCLQLNPAVVARQELTWKGREWASTSLKLTVTDGLPFAGDTDPYVLQMLAGCDGQTPCRQIIQRAVAVLKTNWETLQPACLEVFRRLVRAGILVPPADPATPSPFAGS